MHLCIVYGCFCTTTAELFPDTLTLCAKEKKKKSVTKQPGCSHGGSVVNKPDKYPWGLGFNSWPCLVGWGFAVATSCGIGHRLSSDPELPWLWCRPAAVALIRPLAWEPPYAMGTALKWQKKKRQSDCSPLKVLLTCLQGQPLAGNWELGFQDSSHHSHRW